MALIASLTMCVVGVLGPMFITCGSPKIRLFLQNATKNDASHIGRRRSRGVITCYRVFSRVKIR